MRISFSILACLVAYQLSGQIESGNAVRVDVVNSVTGTPISGANVAVQQERDTLLGRTDAGGAFAGRTHFAGSYLLTVTRKGFRMTTASGIMGKMIEVKEGAETHLTVEMLPLGVIAGRVFDQYGDPVRHAIVSTQNKPGAPRQDQGYGRWAATTDDRGEYRIAEVEPGTHYLAIEYSSTEAERGSAGRSRYRWPKTEGLVLYPNTTDMNQALQVEVVAGRTTRLNDVNLKIQPALTISGKIKPPPVESSQSLSLQRTVSLALSTSPLIQGGVSEADGSFKIDVLPGTYVLTASDDKTGGTSKAISLEVRDQNITGLELELRSGFDISGRFTIDGRERIDLAKLELSFGGLPVKIDGNGTFETKLPGGKATYMLHGLPEDWYLEDMRVGGKTLTGRYFELEPGTTNVLITLSPRGARVEISLEGAVSGLNAAYVTLLPETGEVPDVESILHAEADVSGKFVVRGVPPGSYRVFTLDASNWALIFRPDALLEKYRSSAPLIKIAPGEAKTIVVPVSKIQPQ